MLEPKKYRIETLTDIINATTPENLDNFLADLKSAIESVQMLKDLSATFVKDANVIDIPSFFMWTDDNEHKVNVILNPKQ